MCAVQLKGPAVSNHSCRKFVHVDKQTDRQTEATHPSCRRSRLKMWVQPLLGLRLKACMHKGKAKEHKIGHSHNAQQAIFSNPLQSARPDIKQSNKSSSSFHTILTHLPSSCLLGVPIAEGHSSRWSSRPLMLDAGPSLALPKGISSVRRLPRLPSGSTPAGLRCRRQETGELGARSGGLLNNRV